MSPVVQDIASGHLRGPRTCTALDLSQGIVGTIDRTPQGEYDARWSGRFVSCSLLSCSLRSFDMLSMAFIACGHLRGPRTCTALDLSQGIVGTIDRTPQGDCTMHGGRVDS
jgi:hypothetical protein